jgi:uncharacterized protein YdeI (YjbR/CyaY-like superfamily)
MTEKLYLTGREDWRAWLERNHNRKREVWLIYYKKHTGKPRIPYDDAVEEALCFGWIDSTVQKIDEDKYAQRFTPRTEGSRWSELNLKRARKMIKQGKMTRVELEKFREVEKRLRRMPKRRKSERETILPPDLEEALAKDPEAERNFDSFAPSHKRMYIGWINEAKRPETRKRRIGQTVKWAARNRKPGMDMKYD